MKSIDDDDVTCRLPTNSRGGSHATLEYFIGAATHAQISARVMRKLKRLRKSTPSFREVVNAISELNLAIEQWYSSLHPSVRMDPTNLTLPTDIHPSKALFLYYSYHASLIALHLVLVHPWNAVPIHSGEYEKDEIRRHVLNCTEIVVEAARNIIRGLQHVTVTPLSSKR